MLADDIAWALPEFQRHAASMFRDTFAAYSPGGTTTDADGFEVPAFTAEGTTPGKVSGRSRDADTDARYVDVGGVDRPVVEGGVHIPISALVPQIGWEYVLTAAGPLTNTAMIGRRYRVVDVPLKSYQSALRLDVVEVP